jgi:hypothetical protein
LTSFDNLIVAGCSFSAGTSNIDQAKQMPTTWSHFLLQKFSTKFFYNLSIPGGGNIQILNNLTFMLEIKNYIIEKPTVVILNFSGLDRIDTMCAVDHPDANKNFSWSKDFGFGWITQGSFLSKSAPYHGCLQKNIGFDQVVLTNCLTIVQCLNYLKSKQVKFFFMLMDDDIIKIAPEWFQTMLNQHYQKEFIRFKLHDSISSFVKSKNLLAEDKFHPNTEAYRLIADEIFKKLID